MNHSLWWSSWIGFDNFAIAYLNLWLYSQEKSPSLYFISCKSERDCCSSRGNQHSSINIRFTWESVKDFPWAPSLIAFMYHFKSWPIMVVWNSTNLFTCKFFPSLHMASHRNQCCSTSSSPLPQNSWYLVRDPACWLSIEGFGNPTKMNHDGPSCEINKTLNTLPLLLLLLELVGLEGFKITELT